MITITKAMVDAFNASFENSTYDPSSDEDYNRCVREALEAAIAQIMPDYCYNPDDWEFTCAWEDKDQVHAYGDALDFGSTVMEVATLFKGPRKWVARIPITFDEDGSVDEEDIRWFDTEQDARTAMQCKEEGAKP